MLFNSYTFIFAFLPLFLLFWFAPGQRRTPKLIGLTAASYLFYGYWDWRFTGLMLLSTLIDFWAGRRIAGAPDARSRRLFLVVSVASNLTILGVFKYTGFFARTVNALSHAVGLESSIPILDIVLPVGISFYTFQSMSYSIDVYRGQAEPCRDFWSFAAYVSMFPQLVAGPIVRYSEIDDQFAALDGGRPSAAQVRRGAQIFVLGLAKKLLVADIVAQRIDPMLASWGDLTMAGAWLAMLGYTVQIYFDFSGYSDMAVGLGSMLGFRLPQNFDSPYKARNISAFWRKWHMSLSFWLRDYLYISLGGSRRGRLKTLRNLMITMFLGGLWHGAAWTFVVWGLLHGAYLVVHSLWGQWGKIVLPRLAATAITFLAVVVGWVFFRADSFEMASGVLARMAGAEGFGASVVTTHRFLAAAVVGALAIAFIAPNTWEIRLRTTRRSAIVYGLLFALCVLRLSSPSPFLYFQF